MFEIKALITGASSGIGRDMARELSKRGYDLVLVARDEEKLNQVTKEINTKVEIICADLSKIENCKIIYEKAKDIDILINNAGFGDFGEFIDTDLEKEINMIRTNVIAVHILTKLYLQDMVKKNKGKILNVASIAGFMPGPLMATYYSTKAYIVRLTEGIREEIKKKKSNVQISLLCPGPVKTNFNNIANVKFNIPSLESQTVVKYAIDKFLKGKFIIIPGGLIKTARVLAKITPDRIVAKVNYHMQEKKRKNKEKTNEKRSKYQG